MYREPDEAGLARSEMEIQAREDLVLRAAAGRDRRALTLAKGADPRRALGLVPVRNAVARRAGSVGAVAAAAVFVATYVVAFATGSWTLLFGGYLAMAAGGMAFVGGSGLSRLAGTIAARRQAEAWQRALPFPLVGLAGAIRLPRSPARLGIRAVLASFDADAVALAQDLVWHADDATTVDREVDALVLWTRGDGRSRKPIHDWIRDVVDQVLVPLHGVWPIARAEIVLERRG